MTLKLVGLFVFRPGGGGGGEGKGGGDGWKLMEMKKKKMDGTEGGERVCPRISKMTMKKILEYLNHYKYRDTKTNANGINERFHVMM